MVGLFMGTDVSKSGTGAWLKDERFITYYAGSGLGKFNS
jgi:hypothetical protein